MYVNINFQTKFHHNNTEVVIYYNTNKHTTLLNSYEKI